MNLLSFSSFFFFLLPALISPSQAATARARLPSPLAFHPLMQPVCLTRCARHLPLAPRPLFQQKQSLNNNISQGLPAAGAFLAGRMDGGIKTHLRVLGCICLRLASALGVGISVFQGRESPELPVTKLTH